MLYQFSALLTDYYQLKMAEAYFLSGLYQNRSVFDYFFRKTPYQGGYVVYCGLETLLDILEDFCFSDDDIEYLHSLNFSADFLEYLKTFRFRGDLYSCLEGEIVFPFEPIVQIEANLLEAQLVETVLLNILNFQSLISTKARRIRWVAGHRMLIDFGLRRAQGLGAIYATRAAIIGGIDATSNVLVAKLLGLEPVGTMAHSFIQSFDSELDAFKTYASLNPKNCVLLVDTYDVLESGLPNAIIVAKEMELDGHRLLAIRIDSGDLAYLSKRCREMLDQAGLNYVKIVVSNQLDERIIKSLIEQQAPIDIFGVGTFLITGSPDAALDGIYKLSETDDIPKIKISNTIQKITFPGKKQTYRLHDENGKFVGIDVISLRWEESQRINYVYHPFETIICKKIGNYAKHPILHKVMQGGRRLGQPNALKKIKQYVDTRFALIADEFKRFDNPHIYFVGLSEELNNLRNSLIERYTNKNKIL